VSQETGLSARLSARVGKLAIDVELSTGKGTLVLVGPNGAGKTSLLSLLLGVLPVERGFISVGSALLLDTERRVSVPVEQRQLGYVPQDYGLFPHLTVAENIAFALSCTRPRLDRAERKHKLTAVLDELALGGHAERLPHALSGGEKQRVALARVMCLAPRALLLDEPMAALDVHSRREVASALAASLAAMALPALVVTHDADEARALGQRVAVLEAGRITQCGSWDELVAAPASSFVERFVASAR
jgi:molybdate transport system ATP-binding protein